MATKTQFLDIARGTINQWVDYDGAYGSQCVDEINTSLTRAGYAALPGNAIDLLNSARARGWQTFGNEVGQNPQAGDILVYAAYNHQFGHTGICIADSDGYTIESVEANVDGNADALYNGAPARHVVRTDPSGALDFPSAGIRLIGWARPPFEEERAVTPSDAPSDGWVKDESADARVLVEALNVRTAPSLSADIVATYHEGDVIHYDQVYNGDGYRWISYVGNSGNRRYVACRDTDGTPYCEFY